MKLKRRISWLMRTVQRGLFPHLDEHLPFPMTGQEKRLIKILEVAQVEKYVPKSVATQRFGRKIKEREAIARSYIAKAVYKYPHTRSLVHALRTTPNLRSICGFSRRNDVPSEATFSRAFAEFAASDLGKRVHDAQVKEHMSQELIGHISRDSTAIEGREKPARKPKKLNVQKKKGRPAKGEEREPVPAKRLDVQFKQALGESLAELPTACDRGVKKNAKGFAEAWDGFKLHVDVNDCGLPISAILTSASLHDSQTAIPLMKMTSQKVTYCYDLMDAAYDARQIWKASRELGHIPIIDMNPRNKDFTPMAPHEAVRYKERTAAERFNSGLKDSFGGRNVMVKGATKVFQHLMFGVVALFADQLLKLTGG